MRRQVDKGEQVSRRKRCRVIDDGDLPGFNPTLSRSRID